MLVGLVVGVAAGESLTGGLLGALLGLAVGQAIGLHDLQRRNAALQGELAQFVERFEAATEAIHQRLLKVEQPSPEETPDEIAEYPLPAAPAAPIEEAELTWDIELPPPEPAATAVESAVPEWPPTVRETARPMESPWEESSEPREPSPIERAFAAARDWLLGGNTVLRVGVVLLFLGLAFLLRYATEGMSMPPQAPYIGVAAAALALLGLGWWLRLRRPAYALLLQGAGVAVLYLTVFAAIRLYPEMNGGEVLIEPGAGFVLLVLVTLCSGVLAVLQDALGLAAAAALGGFAAPILASTGGGSHVALFSYFALLNAGILAIAWFKAWRPLNLIGFVGTFGIGFAWGLRSYTPELFASTEPFLLLFFLMYVAIGLLFARRRLHEQEHLALRRSDYVDATVLFGPPLVGFGLQYALVRHVEFGAAFSALALGLFYMGLARLLAGRGVQLLVEVCLALGVVFGSLAIPLGLDARWTSAAWAVEGAGIYWLGLRQRRLPARMFALLLQIGAALAFLGDLRGGVDTLLEGAPLGALMLGAALLFSFWRLRSESGEHLSAWESNCRPVLACAGLAFLYLVAPLCFAAEATTIAWALAGLAALVAGLRLRSRSFLACGLVVQLLGGALLLLAGPALYWGWSGEGLKPLAHIGFWAPTVLALAALAGAWWLHRSAEQELSLGALDLERLSQLLLAWGAGWWALAALGEIVRFVPDALREHAALLVAALSVAMWTLLALREGWRALAALCLTLAPLACLALASAWRLEYHPLANLGWLGWLAFLLVHLLSLRRLDELLPKRAAGAIHVLGCWLILGVLALELRFLFYSLAEHYNAWRWLGWALVPSLFLVLMGLPRQLPWPVAVYPREYRAIAALPVALLLFAWFWLVNLLSDGAAEPLPYLPLLNPLELGMLIVLAAIHRWALAGLPLLGAQTRVLQVVIGASLFGLATMAVCRAAHHWAGVPFEPFALRESMVVQAGLSIVWTLIALGLMVFGHLRARRELWMVGAALIGVVVIKLFFVELGNSGSLARIVSFIGVGVLLLIVGYFAPLPPRRAEPEQEQPSA